MCTALLGDGTLYDSVEAMGDKGNLAILIGELSDEPAHGRTDGIKQGVKEQFPNIKVTREQTGHWKR